MDGVNSVTINNKFLGKQLWFKELQCLSHVFSLYHMLAWSKLYMSAESLPYSFIKLIKCNLFALFGQIHPSRHLGLVCLHFFLKLLVFRFDKLTKCMNAFHFSEPAKLKLSQTWNCFAFLFEYEVHFLFSLDCWIGTSICFGK